MVRTSLAGKPLVQSAYQLLRQEASGTGQRILRWDGELTGAERHAFCVFEYIYFARPDSKMGGTVLQVTDLAVHFPARRGPPEPTRPARARRPRGASASPRPRRRARAGRPRRRGDRACRCPWS